MKLRLIFENVEKLIPHLKADVLRYFAARKEAGLPIPTKRGYNESDDALATRAVEWALRCDPMYLKGKASGKPLENIKSPFVKHVLRWWLDPKAGGGLELPEDIETTGEMLKQYSNAKQRGLNAELSNIPSWAELNRIMAPYLSAEEAAGSDRFNRMGFRTIFEDGPWKVYLIDKWIPGEASTLYKDQAQHKAMEGTGWCVKYESTFNHYKPPVYALVLYNGRRFALMHLNSLQFKNIHDQPIFNSDPEIGKDFLQRFFKTKKKLYTEVFTKSLLTNYSDFAKFLPMLDLPIPDEHELRAAAEQQANPEVAAKVAKITKQWPHFEDWPKGKQIILNSAQHANVMYSSFALYQLIQDVGRIPEFEKSLIDDGNILTATKYVELLLKEKRDQSSPTELGALVNATLVNAIKRGADAAKALRAGMPAMQTLEKFGAKSLDSDQVERAVLRSQDPAAAFAYAQARMQRWPEGEPLLSYSKSLTNKYCQMFRLQPKDLVPDTGANTAEKEVRRAIANGEESTNEELILTDLNAALIYAQHVVGPWPELEQRLDDEGTPEQQELYRKNVLQL